MDAPPVDTVPIARGDAVVLPPAQLENQPQSQSHHRQLHHHHHDQSHDDTLDHHHHHRHHDDGSTTISSLTGGEESWSMSSLADGGNGRYRLYGRDDEIATIRGMFNRIQQTGQPELLMLEGPSGCGKTSLIEAALRRYATTAGGRFVDGKFDQLRTVGDAFSAIKAAFSDLMILLTSKSTDQTERDRIARHLETHIGEEVGALGRLVPNLSSLMKTQTDSVPVTVQIQALEFLSDERAIVRLGQLCQSFLQAVATTSHPVVLFLDDVQWADRNSMQVIENLLWEPRFRHVLLVISFREIAPDEPERQNQDMIDTIYSSPSGDRRNGDTTVLVPTQQHGQGDHGGNRMRQLPRTVLRVGGLSFDSIQELIVDRVGQDRAEQFTRTLYDAIQGNIIWVLGWLKETSGAKEARTDDVAHFIETSLLELPTDILRVMQLAALVGYRFNLRVLRQLFVLVPLSSVDEPEGSDKPESSLFLSKTIEVAVEQEFITKTKTPGFDEFEFTHDRVQQCLYEMIGGSAERNALHLRIGQVLVKAMKAATGKTRPESHLLFLSTDQMNIGQSFITDKVEKCELVWLNVMSGKRAQEEIAFDKSLRYYRQAEALLRSLPNGRHTLHEVWRMEYELCLAVYEGLASIESANGNGARSSEACHIVIDHAATLEEKLNASMILMVSMANHNDQAYESCLFGLSVLRDLGESVPERPSLIGLGLELVRTRRALQSLSDEDILSLPPMTNKSKLAAVRIMTKLSATFSLEKRLQHIFVLAFLRLCYMTVKFGFSDCSALVFAFYAATEGALNNIATSRRFCTIASRLVDRTQSKEMKSRACLVIGILLPWSRPYQEAIAISEQSHRLAMEGSAFECGLVAGCQRCALLFNTNTPLSQVEAETQMINRQIRHFKAVKIHRMAKLSWQGIHNLMGRWRGTSPLVLTGDVMDEDQFRDMLKDVLDPMPVFCLRRVKIFLACCYDADQHSLESLFSGFGKMADKLLRTHYTKIDSVFFQGLMASMLWEYTGRWKYKSELKSCFRRLSQWTNKDKVDLCRPLADLLDAELLVIARLPRRKRRRFTAATVLGTIPTRVSNGMNLLPLGHHSTDVEEVIAAYNKAIRSADEIGKFFWRALFAKRAFDVLHKHYTSTPTRSAAPDPSLPFLQRAIEYFRVWEAHGVVAHLERQHGHLLLSH